MGELAHVVNIGKVLEEQLNEVEIYSVMELKEIGAKQAWLRIQTKDPSACLLRLQALEGAIEGVKKTELSQEVKNDLKAFYQEHKR